MNIFIILKYKMYLKEREQKLKELEDIRKNKGFKSAQEYLATANSIFGEKRIKSRKKIILKDLDKL